MLVLVPEARDVGSPHEVQPGNSCQSHPWCGRAIHDTAAALTCEAACASSCLGMAPSSCSMQSHCGPSCRCWPDSPARPAASRCTGFASRVLQCTGACWQLHDEQGAHAGTGRARRAGANGSNLAAEAWAAALPGLTGVVHTQVLLLRLCRLLGVAMPPLQGVQQREDGLAAQGALPAHRSAGQHRLRAQSRGGRALWRQIY